MRFQLAAFADEVDTSLEKQIAAMRDNGITRLEIRGVDGENMANLTNAQAREIRNRLDGAGISVWSLGSPYGKSGVEEDFTVQLDRFCHGLELAWILGASHIRLFSFYIPSGQDPEAYRETVMQRLTTFANNAHGSGILLCHENEKGIYGDVPERCAAIHREVPSIRAVFDPANFIQCGQDVQHAWELLEPYVEYMHIKDALEDGTVVPAGQGQGHIPWLLSRYQGETLTVEPHLAVFDGLSGLEREGEQSVIGAHCYASHREAFDVAVTALKSLL